MHYNLERMPPKFQSSFIPKGPIASSPGISAAPKRGEKSLLSFLALIIFSLSIVAAVGAFGYKLYLNYSIKNMTAELETERAQMDQESLDEIKRLNNRMVAASELINRHVAMTPLFRFLESSTLQDVRFTEFAYDVDDNNALKLIMRGEAVSYAALALQAETFNQSKDLKNPVFSDLSLDESGNVAFTFQADVEQGFLSYRKEVERMQANITTAPATTTSATASTTGASTATSSSPIN